MPRILVVTVARATMVKVGSSAPVRRASQVLYVRSTSTSVIQRLAPMAQPAKTKSTASSASAPLDGLGLVVKVSNALLLTLKALVSNYKFSFCVSIHFLRK